MGRKCLYVLAAVLILASLQSCTSKPEQGLLKSYFHAIMLKDVTTMSTMALEPMDIEADSWNIASATEDKAEAAFLPGLNKTEADLKKKLEEHVGPTLDAKDALDSATETYKATRTNAAKAKMTDAQAAYDKILAEHRDLQKNYNDAKAAAGQEEEITKFSLGAGDVSNIRDLTGTVHSKDVVVETKNKAGQVKSYRFYLRQYDLKDEAANLARRGRWIIIRIEPVA
jgi:hypothetical protein